MVRKEVNLKKKNKVNISKNEKTVPTSIQEDIKQPKFKKVLNLKSKKPKQSRNKKKKIIIVGISVLSIFILGLVTYFVLIPVKNIYDSFNRIKESGYSLLADFQDKDLTTIDQHLGDVKNEIDKVNQEINKFSFLATLEQTRGYYDNFIQAQTILNKSSDLLSETLPDLKSLLKESGFKIDNDEITFVTPSTSNPDNEDGAIMLILKELPSYLSLYDSIEPKIMEIFDEIKKIDPEYIPSLSGFDIRNSLKELNKFAEDFPTTSNKIVNFVKEIPELVGSHSEKTYLLILQNETEMRASGGLITSFGTMKIDSGKIDDELTLIDTWQLQYDLWDIGLPMPYSNIHGQAYLMNSFNNSCGATEARVQDSGLYPDQQVVIEYFRTYYDRAKNFYPNKYPDYDHIVLLNYKFSEDLLKLVQPLSVEGFGEVSADTLYEFIKDETDDRDNFYSDDRKGILRELAKAVKEKFFNLELTEMPEVLSTVINGFHARDISLSSTDERLVQYFDEYGLSGRDIYEFDGDYFQLSEAQNCSLKLNRFIRNEIDLNINIGDDGAVRSNALIKWNQTQLYNDSLKDQYDPTLQHRYRAWVRFILPEGTDNTVTDGFIKSGNLYYYPRNYFDSTLQKYVSDNVIQFDHRRFTEDDTVLRETLSASWSLPNTINYENHRHYKLLIQKHPGKSWGEKYNINIEHNGSTSTVDFVLNKDKVILYKDGIISVENYNNRLDWLITLVNKVPWSEMLNQR